MGGGTPRGLLAHRTTWKKATDETPFSLAFGKKVVVIVEMGMPRYRVDHYNPKINEEMARLSLDLLEEKRDTARIRTTTYK